MKEIYVILALFLSLDLLFSIMVKKKRERVRARSSSDFFHNQEKYYQKRNLLKKMINFFQKIFFNFLFW